jgi:hypothetical protein
MTGAEGEVTEAGEIVEAIPACFPTRINPA